MIWHNFQKIENYQFLIFESPQKFEKIGQSYDINLANFGDSTHSNIFTLNILKSWNNFECFIIFKHFYILNDPFWKFKSFLLKIVPSQFWWPHYLFLKSWTILNTFQITFCQILNIFWLMKMYKNLM